MTKSTKQKSSYNYNKDTKTPSTAMILAAGLGIRMRPITDTTPKPLIEVNDRALIDHAIDRLEESGVKTVVVNLHHLGEKIEAHLRKRPSPEILFSHEPDQRLETGGGVKQALPLLGDDPFFVINGDMLWLNGSQSALARMARTWNGEIMDALLMLHSTVDAYGYDGVGDFTLDPLGLIARRLESEVSPLLFSGVQILTPKMFIGAPDGPFSLNLLYDKAIEAGRLYGMVHDGEWFHVGTPDGLNQAETYMNLRYAGNKRR
ncbi:MAG: nucleotidyltransferase family protein [Rhodospirillales bacterium]|nr:nucleotidyltransferase family protein [Rhodospirillales bacterium]